MQTSAVILPLDSPADVMFPGTVRATAPNGRPISTTTFIDVLRVGMILDFDESLPNGFPWPSAGRWRIARVTEGRTGTNITIEQVP